MPATRNVVTVTVRRHGSNGFVNVQRRSFGSEKNLQRQCYSGELEFDTETNKFVFCPAFENGTPDWKAFKSGKKTNGKNARREFTVADVAGKYDMPTVTIRAQKAVIAGA